MRTHNILDGIRPGQVDGSTPSDSQRVEVVAVVASGRARPVASCAARSSFAGAGYRAGPAGAGRMIRIAITAEAHEAIAATLRSAVSASSTAGRDRRTFDVMSASGASVGQVDCLVRGDIDIGRIRRLPVGVFTAQIHATIVALRYFSRRPLAGFQYA